MSKSVVAKFFLSRSGRTALGIFGVVLFIAIVLLVRSLLPEAPEVEKKKVQQITVIAPPPPPPPPPPEQIKEPEIEEEVIEEELEEALPDEGTDEPAGEDLGVDAEGQAGGDSFGLVGKKGGRGLLGGGGSYAGTIKAEINKALLLDDVLRSLEYEVIVNLWVDRDGSFLRYEIETVEGDDYIRREFARVLDSMGGISKMKPLEEKADRFRFKVTSTI